MLLLSVQSTLLPWPPICKTEGLGCGSASRSAVSDSLQPHAAFQALLSREFPSKNTGVGCHFLLQGVFPAQGSNPGSPLCKQILYCLSHQGSSQESYISFRAAIFESTMHGASLEMFCGDTNLEGRERVLEQWKKNSEPYSVFHLLNN